MNLREKLINRKTIFQGRAVGFRVDTVRLPNKKKAVREYLDHPGAVGVVPIFKKNRIVMVKQFRHPVNEITWEIPAGKLSRGENPLSCVKRELEEETGYKAKKYKKLLSFWPTAAFANEIIHLYVATALTPGKANPDDDEFLGCEIWPLSKALRAIKTGKIQRFKKRLLPCWLLKRGFVRNHRLRCSHEGFGEFFFFLFDPMVKVSEVSMQESGK